MLPPELVEYVIHQSWRSLSSSSHRHGYSMAQWMLVNREWLNVVVSVIFRDLWITSNAHMKYLIRICQRPGKSAVFRLVGISDIRSYLATNCRSLTVSVFHEDAGEYTTQCDELLHYAATYPRPNNLLPGGLRYRNPKYTIPYSNLATVIRDYMPHITSLHFVLIDCTATYAGWEMFARMPDRFARNFPETLVELHVSFVFTSPPQLALLDAPRHTFLPLPSGSLDLPMRCELIGVRRLVVREANADFVAFLTTACPLLERIESTAPFGVDDIPEGVKERTKARLEFVRLAKTTTWPGVTSNDSKSSRSRPAGTNTNKVSVWGRVLRSLQQ